MVSVEEVVVLLSQSLLLCKKLIFTRVLLADRQEVAVHLLALSECGLEILRAKRRPQRIIGAATHERERSTIVYGAIWSSPLLLCGGLLDLVAPQETRLALWRAVRLELAELGPRSLLTVEESVSQYKLFVLDRIVDFRDLTPALRLGSKATLE